MSSEKKGEMKIGRYVSIGGGIGLIILVIYNIRNNSNFYDTPIIYILNLLVAVIFAYYLTQKKSDTRNFKQEIENIVDKIQIIVNNPRLVNITSSEDVSYILAMHRTLSNKILILEENEKALNISEDIKVVREKFERYRELIGNHSEDIEYLSKSSNDITSIISIIDDRLDKIRISLYKS